MMEEISLIKDFGGLIVALVFMFIVSKYVIGLSFEQIKINNEKTFAFMESTLKENTKAMNEMVLSLKDHVRTKESAIDALKDKYRHDHGNTDAEVLLEHTRPYGAPK